MYFNTQEEIITKLAKSLEESLILRKKAIKILAGIVIGIILAKSTVVSKIAENLKENFCEGKEESKIKKILYLLLTNQTQPSIAAILAETSYSLHNL